MALPAVAARTARSEEADAVYGVVMAVTAASGAMIAMFDVVNGRLPMTAAPTLILLAALAFRAVPLAAWAGVVTWAVIAPLGDGIAVFAPATMAVACLAFAIGPDRLLDWVHDEWIGRMGDERGRGGLDRGRSLTARPIHWPNSRHNPAGGRVWPMYRSPTSVRPPSRALRAR